MITGIGLDIVELERIRKLDERSPKFRERVLTESELADYLLLKNKRKTEFLAGRFAAKEAFAKARGTGIGASCPFSDMEIRKDEYGKPMMFFRNAECGFVSITHSKEFAAAQVVLQTE